MSLVNNHHEIVYVTLETDNSTCANLTKSSTSVPFIPNLYPECYDADIDMTEANGYQFRPKKIGDEFTVLISLDACDCALVNSRFFLLLF